MSLNIPVTETQPCTKPYTFNLQDCLACSSCVTAGEKELLHQPTEITQPSVILITPHSKLNIFHAFNIQDYQLFENILKDFCASRGHLLVDVSNFYPLLYANKTKFITSSCPGAVKYLQRKGKLVDRLMDVKSVQQICRDIYERDGREIVCVGSCLDKKIEGGKVMTTGEYYQYLMEEGFSGDTQSNNHLIEEKVVDSGLSSQSIEEKFIDSGLSSQSIEEKAINSGLSNHLIEENIMDSGVSNHLIEKNVDSGLSSHLIEEKAVDSGVSNQSSVDGISNLRNDMNPYLIDDHYPMDKNSNNSINSEAEDDINPKTITIDVNTNDIYNDSIHRTVEFNKDFISSLLDDSFTESRHNEHFIEYSNGIKKYARISGMVNFINFINKYDRSGYDFVEAFICKSGCINGPAQLKGRLDGMLEFMKGFGKVKTEILGYKFDIGRKIEVERNNRKTFNVEW